MLEWPAVPEPARIRYLYEIRTPTDIDINPGLFGRLAAALKGDEETEVTRPYGIAVADSKAIYIVDNAYQAVHVFDPQKNDYFAFPKAPIKDFINPVNIALGSNGRIYVSDSVSARVHIFGDKGREYLGSLGQGTLSRPTGLAVNPQTNELLVLDTKASVLFVYDEPSLDFKRTVGQVQDSAENFIGFHYPTNVAVSNEGKVIIADSLNFRIRVMDENLQPITEFGAPGNAPGNFSRPKGIATDSDGHIYIIDAIFDNVQVFEENGDLLLAFGGPGSAPGQFWLPNAIAIDDRDRIYVSDAYNNRIQVFQYLKQQAIQ